MIVIESDTMIKATPIKKCVQTRMDFPESKREREREAIIQLGLQFNIIFKFIVILSVFPPKKKTIHVLS